jgi:hypothetical protein
LIVLGGFRVAMIGSLVLICYRFSFGGSL